MVTRASHLETGFTSRCPFREEKKLTGLKSTVVIRKGIKIRAVHTDPARRVKVNLSQLVRGFPERSICLRRYIQEMKFLKRRVLERPREGRCTGGMLAANGQLLSLSRVRYPFSSMRRHWRRRSLEEAWWVRVARHKLHLRVGRKLIDIELLNLYFFIYKVFNRLDRLY